MNQLRFVRGLGALAVLSTMLSGMAQAKPIAPKSVTVRPVAPAELNRIIAANKGKVVVVNFWATWCPPCVAELPSFAQLQQKNAGKLKVVLVSGDDASAANGPVKKTLAAKGHTSSYLIKGDLVKFFDQFDPKYKSAVALPRTYIYDRKGKLIKAVENDHSYAEYQKMVQPYL
jgi:thiol-disulfide isomerase/thioredoxin